MVTSNILRGSILALIPIAAVLGVITKLGIPFLYGVSFLVGFLQVFFDITSQSYLPSLVRRDQLVEGNRNLQASASTAQVTGPTAAGIVISIITAPIAIAIDASSFFASAFALSRIDHEEVIEEKIMKPSVLADIREGLHVVLSDKRLRMIAGSTGTSNFFRRLHDFLFDHFLVVDPAERKCRCEERRCVDGDGDGRGDYADDDSRYGGSGYLGCGRACLEVAVSLDQLIPTYEGWEVGLVCYVEEDL